MNRELWGLIGGPAGYAEVLLAQGGRCAICGELPEEAHSDGQRLAIDHDHATGMVRGLLCVRCNVGLGSFRDDIAALAEAIAYLEHHRAAHAAVERPSVNDIEGVSMSRHAHVIGREAS